MRKLKALLAVALIASSSAAFAADFDWSQVWCNYGGGIEKGDMLLTVDAGLPYWFPASGQWVVPYVEASFDVVVPIWKLPFTFGGYVGTDLYGSDGYTYCNLYVGGEALYHIMLPPPKLDVYSGVRLGAVIFLGDHSGGGFHWSVVALGANYFFTPNFAVNAEFSYPHWLKAGVTFKF